MVDLRMVVMGTRL